MATSITNRENAPWYNRLFLPAYRVVDAARYTGAHPATVSSWHRRRNPVLPGRGPKQSLAYLELVEVAFVAFFRRAGVSMHRLRRAREYVAASFECEYPFAEYKFKTEGLHILMDAFPLPFGSTGEEIIVADEAGQLAWNSLMGEQFAQFDYEFDLALTWHPAGRESTVRIDPRIAFGEPVVEGIPTRIIKGRWDAGESLAEVGEDYEIPYQVIVDALIFEGVHLETIASRG
ncbi:MAG: DUF433 domain-containing protein [Chloroflexota bacterium]|nr:DUF433 domain-containing protein [Chloroflexota bacterium]